MRRGGRDRILRPCQRPPPVWGFRRRSSTTILPCRADAMPRRTLAEGEGARQEYRKPPKGERERGLTGFASVVILRNSLCSSGSVSRQNLDRGEQQSFSGGDRRNINEARLFHRRPGSFSPRETTAHTYPAPRGVRCARLGLPGVFHASWHSIKLRSNGVEGCQLQLLAPGSRYSPL